MASFNLIDEPWIPCLFPEEPARELSLREVFQQAGKIKEIYDPSPLVTIALHRLLLAIIHRNFGPASEKEWLALWEKGPGENILTVYLDRWHGRFYLFDSKHPFYQVLWMDAKTAKTHPIHLLALEAAAPNNFTLFDHSSCTDPEPFPPALAARYLLACQAYSIGFGKSNPFSFRDSTMIRGYSVLNLGNNLWETLCLNLVDYNEDTPIPWSEEDLPAWEREFFPPPDPKGNLLLGYVDYLTCQSRRIHLLPEGNPPVVRWCQRVQGVFPPTKSDPDQPDRPYQLDPFKAYFYKDKGPQKGWSPRKLITDKAVWRDSHALFQSADWRRRPAVFDVPQRLMGLVDSGEIKAQNNYSLLVAGVCLDDDNAAKILFWRSERLPLPLQYLEDKNLYSLLNEAIEAAEITGDTLKYYLKEIAKMLYEEKSNTLIKGWGIDRLFFSRLEGPFRQLLVELPASAQEGDENKLLKWIQLLQRTAISAFDSITAGLGKSPKVYQAVAQVKGRFTWSLHKKLFEPQEGGSDGNGSESK
jgi:CRISPR system Cascade subunit CasA